MIIDASNLILGRMASTIAKKLLKGEDIVIINAGNVLITGEPSVSLERFRIKRQRGDRIRGPFYSKYPERIVRRVIRGMIPYKKENGRNALMKLKVFAGCPEEFTGKAEKSDIKSIDNISCKHTILSEICKQM